MLWQLHKNLPFYFLLSSITLSSTALPVHSTELTPANFKSSISKGVWLIEHFSPYCGHCKAFAPTWDDLVKENEAQSNPGIRLAQVNCVTHGDLCNENGVSGYPQLNMYSDGKFVEQFRKAREPEILREFMKKHARPEPEPETEPEVKVAEEPSHPPVRAPVNPSGEVLVLEPKSFHRAITDGPIWVKFFAPWCGHCKKLAPTWKQLAKAMQNKLVVAEVDCEAHSALCTSQGVPGFPSLMFYSGDGETKTEYSGGRKLDQLKAFADKATGAASKAVSDSELQKYVDEQDVVYVLLHSSSSSGIVSALSPTFLPLLGSPTVLTIQDPPESLLSRFGIESTSASDWHIVALKDHDSTTPSSIFFSSLRDTDLTIPSNRDPVSKWLVANRLPTTVELTQDTFQSIMNAPGKPLVVIAAITEENAQSVKGKVAELGRKWRAKTGGNGIAKGTRGERPIVFATMDAERWKDWMKSMYGVRPKHTQDLEDIDVFVADHKELIYYKTDSDGSPIRLTSATSVFSGIEGVVNGTTEYLHSENFVERLARYLNKKFTTVEEYIINNPIHALLVVCIVVVLIILGIRRVLADDHMESDFGRGKGGRLD
ncbi:hypothetical protein V5O48_006453 [Marasmius crinis-equi]|uniref:Thioredoxin domain-containing protein n=1 Tax=Marasmius crinis-equi TaxID=585013 RepID=A0ABR3FJG5_9AGAR